MALGPQPICRLLLLGHLAMLGQFGLYHSPFGQTRSLPTIASHVEGSMSSRCLIVLRWFVSLPLRSAPSLASFGDRLFEHRRPGVQRSSRGSTPRATPARRRPVVSVQLARDDAKRAARRSGSGHPPLDAVVFLDPFHGKTLEKAKIVIQKDCHSKGKGLVKLR